MSFGIGFSQIKKLQSQDPLLEELLSDYLALSRDVDAARNSFDVDVEKFLLDAQDSLLALEAEIREKLFCAEQIAKY
ncbi:MAG: hypothetical protein ABJI45_09270 [Paracoccaceae bacterium]